IVITVSHDRYFLDNVVDRIFELDGQGHARQYEGGYTDYLEAKKRENGGSTGGRADGSTDGSADGTGAVSGRASGAGKSWKTHSSIMKFTNKEQREEEPTDDALAALEEKLSKIEKQIAANATTSVKLRELMEEQDKTQAQLEKTERWLYLNEPAEKIE